jgi:hypothetical protein
MPTGGFVDQMPGWGLTPSQLRHSGDETPAVVLVRAKDLESIPTTGLVPEAPGLCVWVAVTDLAGSKMDAYLETAVICASASRCQVAGGMSRITVTLKNNAPTGLPTYVDIRADSGGEPGSTKIGIAEYAPVGSELLGYTLDG